MSDIYQPLSTTRAMPLLLSCPICHERHIDEGEFATRLHHTHACQTCGHVWRPAIDWTVGVRFLPGFKNPEPARLDADRTATPKTRLVAHVPAGKTIGMHEVERLELRDNEEEKKP